MNAKKIFDNGLEMQGVINTVMFELKKSNDDRTFEEFVIDSIKKTELPVIPQFVADWIEKRKDDFKSSYDAVTYIKSCGWDDEAHVEYEVYEWLPENLLAFCQAWELGYTIEQPKLLTVIVKDYDKTIMSKQMPEDEVEKMMEGLG